MVARDLSRDQDALDGGRVLYQSDAPLLKSLAELEREQAARRQAELEPIVFPDCHECPKPGYFHGNACWVFAERRERERSARRKRLLVIAAALAWWIASALLGRTLALSERTAHGQETTTRLSRRTQ